MDPKEEAELTIGMKYLTKAVEDGFCEVHKKFDDLDCKSNTLKVDEMYREHTENKQLKQHFAKTVISQFVKAGGFVAAGVTAAYAYLK